MKLPSTVNSRRPAIASAFLVANALIWYFLAASTLEELINQVSVNSTEKLLIWSIHFGIAILALIGGTLIVKKIGRKTLFVFWTLLGALSPLTVLALNLNPTAITFLVGGLFGLSLGIGLPNCLEFFRKSTAMSNRGKYAGIIVLISGLGTFLLSALSINIESASIILVLFRLCGLVVVWLPEPLAKPAVEQRKQTSFSFIKNRTFLLYLVPWMMFSIVNYLGASVRLSIIGESQVQMLTIIENIILGLSAIGGGFLSDFIGRKRTAIVGFILLGLGCSFLGLFPYALESWYFHTIVDGIAWGFLYVIFVIVVWGELDNSGAESDKIYAIGLLPFFISKLLEFVIGDFIGATISPYALFSFVAFFLFIAVLPLVYAPETLPEKILKDRELKSYVENAKKKAEKETEKTRKKDPEPQEPADSEEGPEPQGDQNYDAAKALAEKYY